MDNPPVYAVRLRRRRRIPPLRKGVYLLPNLLTSAGLFSGFYSIICTLNATRGGATRWYWLAAVMILVAQLCHALDQLLRHPVRLARRPGRLRRGARHPRLPVGAPAVGALGLARRLALRDLRRAPAGALQRADRFGREAVLRRPPHPGGGRRDRRHRAPLALARRRGRDRQAHHDAARHLRGGGAHGERDQVLLVQGDPLPSSPSVPGPARADPPLPS